MIVKVRALRSKEGKIGIDPRELGLELLRYLEQRGYIICYDTRGEKRKVRFRIVGVDKYVWLELEDSRSCILLGVELGEEGET